MAENNKNALTDLSEKLAMYADFHKEEDKANKGILTKASRIIAELAKVEDWTNDFGADEPRPYSSVSAIKECREIAEKGTK